MSAAYDTRAPKPEASAIALHRLDAEQALLGAILFDNETLNRIGPLAPEHFYDPAHQRIFAAIKGHVSEGKLAALYERFGTKEKIFAALVEERSSNMRAPLVLEPADNGATRISTSPCA